MTINKSALSFVFSLNLILGQFAFALKPAELPALNNQMIRIFKGQTTRRSAYPAEVNSAIQSLIPLGFATYLRLSELAGAASIKEAVLQEYLRKQEDWGMPWLPLSWGLEHQNIESNYSAFTQLLEARVSVVSGKPDDDVLEQSMFTQIVPHSKNSVSFVNSLRAEAEELASSIDESFYDIRLEIHNEPSSITVKRVEDYLRGPISQQARTSALKILEDLKNLLAQSDLRAFIAQTKMNTPNTTSADWINLNKETTIEGKAKILSGMPPGDAVYYNLAQNTLDMFGDISSYLAPDSRRVSGLFGYLDNLVAMAKVLQTKSLSRTSNATLVYFATYTEWYDLLNQISSGAFIFANQYLSSEENKRSSLSLGSMLRLSYLLTVVSYVSGYIPQTEFEKFQKAGTFIQKNEARINPGQLSEYLAQFDQLFIKSTQRLRRLFSNELAQYKQIVPKVDSFIDDTLRSSPLLPLSRLTEILSTQVQLKNINPILISGESKYYFFKVLNPGIARGTLFFPTEAETSNDNFPWNPDGIYFLEKTPAEIQKISGVLTCDSGSMISHVQLLAKNHGLPNVRVNCGLKDQLAKYKNKEILMYALPSGELHFKLFSEATADELEIYHAYHQIKQNLKVTIPIPDRLDINYPLQLEQLRLADAGKVAGGKACGQGELARLFKDRVPHAIVLPFGVYYQHVKESGLYDFIQKALSDPEIKGTDPQKLERRKKILAGIRARIMAIELKAEIKDYIYQFLMTYPVVDHGVFVRSDTNAEDLPGFVGAGLNLTLPNVRGVANVFAAIKEVWASPFQEKAFSWRQDLISNPWDLYPSVVIQIAIPSKVAGVMVVGDTQEDDFEDSLLIAANEGLGITTVNGEFTPEEILYSRKSNTYEIVGSSYAKSKKVLNPAGGISEAPVTLGNRLVSDSEVLQLKTMGDMVQKYFISQGRKEKWDMEWGVLENQVVLLQMRPFIGNKIARNLSSLKRLQKFESKTKNDGMMDLNTLQVNLSRPR